MAVPEPGFATDLDYMNRALDLARSAKRQASPNPAVGCVIVNGGRIVGEGCTQPPGGPHAERVALTAAGELARGATLYSTLEPCAHFGRTPPCTDAIIAAGIRRVVSATSDPFPQVNGRGFAQLGAAGIAVESGLCDAAATALNRPFFTRIQKRRPFVVYKFATTLDGKIATRTGDARWVSGEPARARVHALRAELDAVMVGSQTALADDPALNARPVETQLYQPLRIVVDSQARLAPTARVLHEPGGPVLVAVAKAAPTERRVALERAGATIWCGGDERVDLAGLLAHLAQRPLNSVLLEGGSTLAAALFELGLIDRVVAVVAPLLVGGLGAPTPLGGAGRARMQDALRLHNVTYEPWGDDLAICGDVCEPA
ncbi:MAG TPA: bifunctional diaminohydroxyphosphoribosylaminopyrimidine deaminase/5-amino-6-(5-phosphoribosylamino)uracil reductase RibD [Limnochordia bacterium]|nr:bifunctional diaminohydroxyphosphoribosylaminopyrimidine deaminase/5-amino-6-(5-phosphoribosylamino)uracil reductase RibD [Limnochordia bacterium]